MVQDVFVAVGKPEPAESEMLSGKLLSVPVTWNVKFAGTPAGTVIVAGVPGSTVILKSCTGAVLLAVWVWVPGAVTEMLFDIAPGAVSGVAGAVGVRLAVMVIEAPEFNVPILHVTIELTAVPQLP